MAAAANIVPRSLVYATGLDVLPLDAVVERRDGFLLVRSPGSPTHYWGNFLLFDHEPIAGDGLRWEALFDDAFGDDPRIVHRTFGWDRTDGVAGAAHEEFAARGYEVDESHGLVADARRLAMHPRANREVRIQALDPSSGADEELWEAVAELQVAGRDVAHEEEGYRTFVRTRLDDRRALFGLGQGAWYVAIDPATRAVVGSCGVVVRTAVVAGFRRWTRLSPIGVRTSAPSGS